MGSLNLATLERLSAKIAPPNPPRVSVIIPTRNGTALLHECLEALWHQTYRDSETIVVDDASTDGTYEMLLGYPEITTVVTLPGTRGHGFVAAVNAGLEKARGEIIVLLNNDAVPDPVWLEELVSALDRHPWAAMAASKLTLYDRPGIFHSTGDYYGLNGLPDSRGVWKRDVGQYEREEEVFGPCAAAAGYRRTMLADLVQSGGTQPPYRLLDPQLWMYCEDVDLNLRARLRGYRTVYVPGATVRHRLSATGGGSLASYYVGRNLIYLIAKDLPRQVIIRNLPRIVFAQVRLAMDALLTIRGGPSRARLRGMVVGFLTWPRVLSSRRQVSRTRRISSRQFESTLRRFANRQDY